MVVTHDISTLAGHVFARRLRVNRCRECSLFPSVTAVGRAIDDLLLLTECSHSGEWDGLCSYEPTLLRTGDRTGLSSGSSTLRGEFQHARQQRSAS